MSYDGDSKAVTISCDDILGLGIGVSQDDRIVATYDFRLVDGASQGLATGNPSFAHIEWAELGDDGRPEEAPDCIEPEEGRDLCTLVTCTPYGVNTHRLLVTGERCEYVPAGEPASTRAYVNNRTIPFLIGLGIVFALVILMILIHLRRRKRRVTTRA